MLRIIQPIRNSMKRPMKVQLPPNVATRSAQGSVSVIGFSAHLVPGRLEDLNAFTLAHKSIANYLWLVLTALMPVITIGTAVRLVAAKGMPRRWLGLMRASIASTIWQFSTTRMLEQYVEKLYLPAAGAAAKPAAAELETAPTG